MTSTLSLAHFGIYSDSPAALLVLAFELATAPGGRHRFKSVNILIQLKPVHSTSSVSILKYWPEQWDGAPSSEKISQAYGVGGSIGFSVAGVGATIDPNFKKSRSFTRHRKRSIKGAALGAPVRNRIRWALDEDAVEKDGIWQNFKLAILAKHESQFSLEVEVKAKVGFSANPRKLLWPLKGKSGTRVVNPSVPIGEVQQLLTLDQNLEKVDIAKFTSFKS